MTLTLLLAAALGMIGLVLIARGIRARQGVSEGRTVSLDKVTLRSERLRLVGRPDRIVRRGGEVIPEEWKSARRLSPWHRAQLGVYFLLIEDQWGLVPPHGFVVLGDGTRHRIANDARLRAEVFRLVEGVRAARLAVDHPIPVNPDAWQCRPCGQRGHCGHERQSSRVNPSWAKCSSWVNTSRIPLSRMVSIETQSVWL